MNEWTIKLIFGSHVAYLPLLRHAVRGICACATADEQFLQDIELCLTEAICNIINHSYRKETGREIEITITLYPYEVVLQLVDTGIGYHHIGIQFQPKFDCLDVQILPESGMGLFLIHQLMSEVIYTSSEGKNILIMRKYIN